MSAKISDEQVRSIERYPLYIYLLDHKLAVAGSFLKHYAKKHSVNLDGDIEDYLMASTISDEQVRAALSACRTNWSQSDEGFMRAALEAYEATRAPDPRVAELVEATAGLLQDTQHKDHDCGDEKWCPVIRARAARAAMENENG